MMGTPKRADRTAVTKAAHRIYFSMNWKGPSDWDFPRCLRLAHAEISGRKNLKDIYTMAEIECQMRKLLKK